MLEIRHYTLQIVDTIGSVDDLIEFNEVLIQKIKALINLKYLISKFETTETTLGNCFDISIGRTPPTKENQWFSDNNNDNKWLSIKDMSFDGDYIFNTSQYLTSKAVENFHIPIVEIGDILLSFKLTVGRIGIAATKMFTNEAIACFKVKEENMRFYLYCYLNNCNFLSDADNTSSIGQAINSTIIKNYKFKKPNANTLNRFNDTVRPLFETLNKKRLENIFLNTEKALLLQKYFG
ncbi:MAG: restriction endonuclease subunit S [Muribaculaceae bacterium]|nr:restriction endonuclease subunit S [Muribaculaceae bacterium]